MSGELSIELSLDDKTKLLTCRMNNNSDKTLVLRRPVPPLDLKISGPPGTAPHYMIQGHFTVPNVTIEPGQQYLKTFQLPGNFAFTVPGEYSLHFSYRSLRHGGPGKTEGVDDVSAESNSVTFVVKPEDLPPRRAPRVAGGANKESIPNSADKAATPAQRSRPSRAKAGRAHRP